MTDTTIAITSAKNRARSLEKFMKKQGVQLPYTQYLEAIAQIDHQVSWQVFIAGEQKAAAKATALASMLQPAIEAEVHSDDRHVEVEFNAAEWFAQADDDEILKLQGIGWGGNYEADNVAEYFMLTTTEALFDYTSAVDSGFECHVDEDSALAWLKIHRPGVWAQILCTEAEVTIVAAEEPELQGMFDWLRGDVACHRSFDSEASAALDAVEQLGLASE